ncbi:MAG: condensation domain-containing protein [Desulfomonilaceae bacterium]
MIQPAVGSITPDCAPKFDAISEMLALTSYGHGKNIIFSALELKGPVDCDAFSEAVQRAGQYFPNFLSTIKEIKLKGRYHLCRCLRPDLSLQFCQKDLLIRNTPGELLDNVLDTLRSRLDRDWDLFSDLPAEIHLVKVSEKHHVLCIFIHHVAGDASNLMEFGQKLFAIYHEIVAGQPPAWAPYNLSRSGSWKRPAKPKPVMWKETIHNVTQTLTRFLKTPALPSGVGDPGESGQHQISRLLSKQDSQTLLRLSGGIHLSLADCLTAASHLAVDEWNRRRNIAPGTLTTSLSVNMRGRYKDLDGHPNNSALLFLRSFPHQRTDPDQLNRALATQRIRHFRSRTDHGYYESLESFNNVLRILPFPARRKLASHILSKHKVSIAISLLGVLWPELVDGKPTGGTFLRVSGDVEIVGVHGLGYRLASNTQLFLTVYLFRNRLNMILGASVSLFNRQEADGFMDLIMENLLTMCRGSLSA